MMFALKRDTHRTLLLLFSAFGSHHNKNSQSHFTLPSVLLVCLRKGLSDRSFVPTNHLTRISSSSSSPLTLAAHYSHL